MSDISSKTAPRSRFSVREICYSGLFAAVIAIMAQISIPMPGGVPMTMQTFAITLAAVVLGAKLSHGFKRNLSAARCRRRTGACELFRRF